MTIFFEYDKNYNLIKKYQAKINKNYIYSIKKYSFDNFWFSN